MKTLPILAITLGDPCGSGPEITVKALSNKYIYDICRPLVIGDSTVLKQALKFTNLDKNLKVNSVGCVENAVFSLGTIDVFDLNSIPDASALNLGTVNEIGGSASFKYVETAISLALNGQVHGTVTNAISKQAINLAGHHFSGHTEIYSHFTNTKKYCMMLAHQDFRVTHVSTHVSLREACNRCKKERVYQVIELSHQACLSLGIKKEKIRILFAF